MNRPGPILLVALLMFTGIPAQGDGGTLQHVTVSLNNVHSAQFAGMYMAKARGLYAAAGLDVEFVIGYYDSVESDQLRNGQAQIAVKNLALSMIDRDRGLPIVNIAQIFQKSAAMVVARKDSSRKTIADLNGLKLGIALNMISDYRKAVLRELNLSMTIVPVSQEVTRFLWKSIDCVVVYAYDDYQRLILSGIDESELIVFPLADMGINFPAEGMYVLQEYLDKNPKVCAAFVDATMEGWRLAFGNMDEAVSLCVEEARNTHNFTGKAEQRRSLAVLDAYIGFSHNPDGIGRLQRETFDRAVRFLMKHGLIKQPLEYAKFYRGR